MAETARIRTLQAQLDAAEAELSALVSMSTPHQTNAYNRGVSQTNSSPIPHSTFPATPANFNHLQLHLRPPPCRCPHCLQGHFWHSQSAISCWSTPVAASHGGSVFRQADACRGEVVSAAPSPPNTRSRIPMHTQSAGHCHDFTSGQGGSRQRQLGRLCSLHGWHCRKLQALPR